MGKSVVQTQNISSEYNVTVFDASPAPAAAIGVNMTQSFGVLFVVKGTTITRVHINASGVVSMGNSVVVKDIVIASQDADSGATATNVILELNAEELKADFGSGFNLDSAGLTLQYVTCTVTAGAVTAIAIVRNKNRPSRDSRTATVYET